MALFEKSLSFPLLVGFFFCNPNHCSFGLIRRTGSEIHCFSSFRNHSQGFDMKPVWLKAGPKASLKIFLNLSTIPGRFSNLQQKPRSGKVCKFLGRIRKLLYMLCVNSHHLFSCWENLSLQSPLLPQRAQLCFPQKGLV